MELCNSIGVQECISVSIVMCDQWGVIEIICKIK